MMGRMGTEGAGFRLIAGRYRLEERVGRGGMGVVWRASDQVLGRQVAVKELLPDDSLPDDDARRRRERTFREARAVCQLRHPHIIVVHDVVEQDERPYLVMELIDGGSLADRISRHGPVDAAEAARIGIALLSALHTAHEAGVLHRDIKPANVLIESGTDRVVLTDFGIAQVAGATTLTETGSFVGSPEYTAPERMSGLRTGPESDLWSLGALLCTVLSGESPFRRDSLGGILHAVVADDIRPPGAGRAAAARRPGPVGPRPRPAAGRGGRRVDAADVSGDRPDARRSGRPGHGGTARRRARPPDRWEPYAEDSRAVRADPAGSAPRTGAVRSGAAAPEAVLPARGAGGGAARGRAGRGGRVGRGAAAAPARGRGRRHPGRHGDVPGHPDRHRPPPAPRVPRRARLPPRHRPEHARRPRPPPVHPGRVPAGTPRPPATARPRTRPASPSPCPRTSPALRRASASSTSRRAGPSAWASESPRLSRAARRG
ncbi:hypothetical protein GCM10017687_71400 [Streptomyces echinatus]